ncbi:MAG TPA: hypothetical protein VJ011_07975 [Steroidobacteraceae bacterium]|nr:hypothetical protein [Steroidobacteraceae bacterium]
MKKKAGPAEATRRVGDAAVKARTGRDWQQWFTLLDRAGAAKLDHKAIVALLTAKMPQVEGWWQQMVTVAYEQARGLRQLHEKPGGFEVSANRTIPVPIARTFEAWTDERLRSRWLDDASLVVHTGRLRPSKTQSLRRTGT